MAGWARLGNAAAGRPMKFPHKMNGLDRLARIEMLYYNKHMLDPDHHSHAHQHHHHPGGSHPPASVHPSILRLSALQRLALAAVAIAALWLAVFWAMR
jgi:hypothetical protein